ncbi:MAG: tetratricopeptide (TPR) repeat protein [Gammaproteobacteria bacterium]|jgi:tetratricopeptide (TPR) repeat protein
MGAVVARVAVATGGGARSRLWIAPLFLAACSPGAPMGWDGIAHQAKLNRTGRLGSRAAASDALEPLPVLMADTADRALERARAKKQALQGERGESLTKLRAEAVAAYVRVHERWPKSGATAAEAAFRAGELLRAGQEPQLAIEQFLIATKLNNPGEFAARSLYEIGHVQRREGNIEPALAAFEQLVASGPVDAHLRDMSSVWYAKVLAEAGQLPDAERVLRRLTKTATEPTDRIRAYDELILMVVERGELEGAAGWLAECKHSVRESAGELTAKGQRVTRALERMRGLTALQVAIKSRMQDPAYDPLR